MKLFNLNTNQILIIMRRKTTRISLLLFLFAFLNLGAFAQVQVGTGTNTSQSLPINAYFGYSYSQVIYLASEINASGDITELQWYFNGSSLSSSNDWTIYIGHTTKTSFSSTTDWVAVGSMTQVFSATFTDPGAAGWITFDITDWTYNGTDNIVVAVDENASGYDGSSDDFYCTSVTGNRGIYYYSDGTNPDPASPPTASGTASYIANIIFGGITQTCPAPSAQTETNIGATQADLGWTENGTATSWNIEYGLDGFTQGSGTTIAVTSNPYTLSGLTQSTDYDWYVQSDCGGGDESAWVGPSSFTTTAACPAPTAQTETNITATSVDLGWTENGTATTWNIEWGATGFTQGSGTLALLVSNPHTLSGLTTNTTYDWYVQADCDGTRDESTWVGPSTFTTLPGAHPFPLTEDFESGFTYFDNAPGNDVDWVMNTSIYHGGAQSAHNAYSTSDENILHETGILDLSSTTGATLVFWHIAKTEGGYDECYVEVSTDGGSTYAVLPASTYQGAASGYGTNEYFHEDDYTEWGTGNETPDNTWWKEETFSLASYNVANVRFRFRLDSDVSTNRAGWYVDDIVVDEPSCPAPSVQTETNITTTSADLGWTENGTATSWNIEYGATGFTQGSGTTIAVTSNPYTLSGLTASTDYDWYVQSDCGGDQSNWTGPSTFATACAPFTAPFSENFDGVTTPDLPSCWSKKEVASSTYAYVETSTLYSNSAPNNARMYNSSSTGAGTYLLLITPELSDLTTQLNQIRFQGRVSGYAQNVIVGTMSDPTDETTFTAFQTIALSIDSYTEYTVVFDASYTLSDKYIAFRHEATTSYRYMNVDDFVYEPIPSCPAPTAQTEGGITATSANLGWTESGTATSWNIEYGATGFTQGSGTMITGTTTNPHALSGLTAATTYDWYVQADCGGGSTSTWTGPSIFTTLCATYTPDYLEDFTTFLPDCWDENKGPVTGPTGTPGDSYWQADGFANNGSTGSARVNLYTTGRQEWLITPNFDLTVGGYELNFDVAVTTYSSTGPSNMGSDDEVQLLVTTDGGTTWSNLMTWNTGNTPSNTGDNTTVDISGYTQNPVQFAFWASDGSVDDSEDYNFYLDNFQVRTPPSCPAPTDQTETNIGGYQADLGWTTGGASTWDIEWGATGFTQGSGTMITGTTDNPYTLTGLSPTTDYDWYVRDDCGGGGVSAWTGPSTFTTTVACPAPTAQTETNITTTSADLGWTAGGIETTWNIEWGPTGFTQGSGTLVTLVSNPHTLSGLTASTTYDWYVQSDCDGTRDESTWVGPSSFTTSCTSTTVPYFEDFDAVTAPAFPPCMTVENTNADGYTWETNTTHLSPPNSARIRYNTSAAMNDWFFTEGLQLTGGTTYEVDFAYWAESGTFPEKLAVDWGNAAASTSMSGTPIFDDNNVDNVSWEAGSGTFTPATTGTYYVGFHGYSDANQFYLFVDDIQVVEAVAATTWTGGTDNDWDNGGNWSGGVPSSGTDVTVPTGLTNYPTLSHARQCNSITIQSDATGDASILNDGLLATGSATVQRFITGAVWHDLSASTQGQTVNALYQGGSPDVWLRTYNEPTNTRTYITELTDPLDPGAGFEVWVESGPRYDITVDYTGALRISNVTLTTSSTPALSYSGPDPLGYNLIGNPFASPLDWDIGTWSLTDVGGTVWVWDHTAGNWKDRVGGAGSLTDGIIPMGQGFFVQTTGASPSITIPMDARVHSSQAYYKSTSAEDGGSGFEQMSLKVFYGQMNDEMNIVFAKEATELYDNGRDARKMFPLVGDAPVLYAYQSDEMLSTNGLPLLEGKSRTVDVHFVAGADGDYQMQANLDNLPDVMVWLEDRKTGDIIDLQDKPEFTFTAYSSEEKDRFVLHFNPIPTGIENPDDENLIFVYAFDDKLCIRSTGNAANEDKEVWIYDMFGRAAIHTDTPASTFTTIPVHQLKGYVVVKIISESGVKTSKVYIK